MKIRNFFVVVGVCVSTTAIAFDQPTQFRAPFLNEIISENRNDWVSTLSARIATGSTRDAFNAHEQKKPLFNAYGPCKLAHLGLGLQNVADASRPQTSALWSGAGRFADPSNINTATTHGDAEFAGHFKVRECDVIMQQNLMWGLYVQGYLPCKEYKIDSIVAKNVGAATVNTVNMATFIRDTLPEVLKENGFVPYDKAWSKTGFGDAIVSLGWHGTTDSLEGLVSRISGFMHIGGLIPTGARRDENVIFAVPLGSNGHWGVVTRAAGELEVWNSFSLGAQVGSTLFFSKMHTMRLHTDRLKKQNGWIALEKGRADVDQGSMWDAGAYVKVGGNFVKGLALVIGYSFVNQEDSHVHVKDAAFLKDVITQQAALAQPNFVSQDDVANADNRFNSWQTQTLHCSLQYQPSLKVSPLFKIEYAHPVVGKYSWATAMTSGTLGLSMDWGF